MNLFVQLINLRDNWLTKHTFIFKGKAYELKQLFYMKFSENDYKLNVRYSFLGKSRHNIPISVFIPISPPLF